MVKSRWEELYPRHDCQQCGLTHAVVPLLTVDQPIGGGKTQKAKLVPFEVLGVVEGTVRPGKGSKLDTPARLIGFLWGHPGANRDVKYKSTLFMN